MMLRSVVRRRACEFVHDSGAGYLCSGLLGCQSSARSIAEHHGRSTALSSNRTTIAGERAAMSERDVELGLGRARPTADFWRADAGADGDTSVRSRAWIRHKNQHLSLKDSCNDRR